MHRFTGSTLSVIVIVLAMLCGVARAGGKAGNAAPERVVAILALDIEGGARAQIERVTQESIVRNLEAEGMGVVTHEEVTQALRKTPDLIRCVTAECMREIAAQVDAGRFIKLAIESSAGAYTFDIEVLNLDGVSRKTSGTCPVCTVNDAGDEIGRAVVEALASADDPPPSTDLMVEILTDPPGARLSIDGNDIGVAPYRGVLAAGSHDIVATLDGHEVANKKIEVVVGPSDAQRFEIKLIAGGVVPAGGSRPFRTVKWIGAGVAVGALAWGSVWVAVDGSGTCGGPIETCPEVYNTRTPGFVLAGAGVVIGAATVWMFLRDSSDSRPSSGTEVMVAPTGGGAVGSVKLRF